MREQQLYPARASGEKSIFERHPIAAAAALLYICARTSRGELAAPRLGFPKDISTSLLLRCCCGCSVRGKAYSRGEMAVFFLFFPLPSSRLLCVCVCVWRGARRETTGVGGGKFAGVVEVWRKGIRSQLRD